MSPKSVILVILTDIDTSGLLITRLAHLDPG